MDPQHIAEDAVRTFLANDTAARALGITVGHTAPGQVSARMTISAEMVNGHGSAHGAALYAVADIAFAMACNSHGYMAIGRSCSIEYLAPAFPGDAVTARAVERVRAGRSGIYDVAVRRDSDGALLAELRAISRVQLPAGSHEGRRRLSTARPPTRPLRLPRGLTRVAHVDEAALAPA